MRLPDFILLEMEAILAQWDAFAATLLPAASGMSSLALRDHAQQILEAIVKDLATSQTRDEQSQKSWGQAPRISGAPETAAQTHAVLRARGGFDINQLAAEYRALRASVVRLWMDHGALDDTGVEDMIRFNEAIDQAIAESVGHYHQTVERYRNLLFGMLGHDMRNPLNSILMTAQYLARLNAGERVSDAAERLIASGSAMQALLNDLTDFNRANLGLGLKIVRADVDLSMAVIDELNQFHSLYPEQAFTLTVTGETSGRWDRMRIQQALRNLVSNAVKYGSPNAPVQVCLHGEQSDIRVEVKNRGTIDQLVMHELFDPLKRGSVEPTGDEHRDGLGLGLFIVREIAKAHGGEVEARCEGDITTFAVRLPRVESVASQDVTVH